MFTIGKTFTFAAAHHLPDLPPDHKCKRVHGHNYEATVTLQATDLNDVGMVRDYADLEPIRKWINENWDHRDLNDLYSMPTAEELAAQLYLQALRLGFELAWVTVRETGGTFAEFRP